jgi:predicted GH43/DUF377 family glycosyl hydrolase
VTGAHGEAESLLTRHPTVLSPDSRRVITELFVPGERLPDDQSRAAGVMDRIMALSDEEVKAAYDLTLERYSARHRDVEAIFADNFAMIGHRLEDRSDLSDHRRLLIGAYFTREYSIEGAALTNPSMVEHPDQSGVEPGGVRFLMSVRAVGESHVSCIEFRTGMIGADGSVSVDVPSPYVAAGHPKSPVYDKASFVEELNASGNDNEIFAFVSSNLPDRFTIAEIEQVLGRLPARLLARRRTHDAIERIHWVAACRYDVEFPEDSGFSERVLWPYGPTERHGMEDARFVRSVDAEGDGSVHYRATYTAFDGTVASPQLIETEDFRTFRVSQLLGPAAQDKGLALFPRPIGGTHFALSRWDKENSSVATSPDGLLWDHAQSLHPPERSWEIVQTGNCGSPIETSAGWLVLIHGVGPVRSYSIGAMLLDLDDPCRVIAALDEPLLTSDGQRDGYVPNVVYSCGALKHGDTLVIPYGFSDTGIGFISVPIPGLIDRMRRLDPQP